MTASEICSNIAIVLLATSLLIFVIYVIFFENPKWQTVKPNYEIDITLPKSYKYTCITEENRCVITIEFNPSINQP